MRFHLMKFSMLLMQWWDKMQFARRNRFKMVLASMRLF